MNIIQEAFRLEGKVTIITGCDTDLGQGMAVVLTEAGCGVAGVGRKIPHEASEEANTLGRRFIAIQANLSHQGTLTSILTQTVSALGRVDILVNNAGAIHRQDTSGFSEKDWDDVMNLNLKPVFFLSQAVARQFLVRGSGGKIINITSMLSFQGDTHVPSYTASGSGVLDITRPLANEWAAKGINVNAIAPGYTATNSTQRLRADSERNRRIIDRIPAGRWGAPNDLRDPVVFLASPASDYIHGHTLAVDDGWLAR